jgi:hypothetical protein
MRKRSKWIEGVKKPIWLVVRAFFGEAKCIPMCERSFVGLLVAKSLDLKALTRESRSKQIWPVIFVLPRS